MNTYANQAMSRHLALQQRLELLQAHTMSHLREEVRLIAAEYIEFTVWGAELVNGKVRILIFPANSWKNKDLLSTVWIEKPCLSHGDGW